MSTLTTGRSAMAEIFLYSAMFCYFIRLQVYMNASFIENIICCYSYEFDKETSGFLKLEINPFESRTHV